MVQYNSTTDWEPADYSLLSWAFDPVTAASASTPLATGGTLYLVKLHLLKTVSVTNIETFIVTAGSVLTAGQCFAALFSGSQGGALIGTTADQSGTWNSGGVKTMALAGGPFLVPTGDVFVGYWFNGTTGPAILRGASSASVNYKFAAASARFATANTGLTTTAPATVGALSVFSTSYWAALS